MAAHKVSAATKLKALAPITEGDGFPSLEEGREPGSAFDNETLGQESMPEESIVQKKGNRTYSTSELHSIYRPFFVIDPRRSKVMPYWDITMMMALLFTAIFTPYEVTFLEEGPCVTIIFIINRFIDILFLSDILIIFNLAYQEESGAFVYEHRRIAENYLRGFFVIDLFSVLPFWTTVFLLSDGTTQCSPYTGQIVNISTMETNPAGKATSTISPTACGSTPPVAPEACACTRARWCG